MDGISGVYPCVRVLWFGLCSTESWTHSEISMHRHLPAEEVRERKASDRVDACSPGC